PDRASRVLARSLLEEHEGLPVLTLDGALGQGQDLRGARLDGGLDEHLRLERAADVRHHHSDLEGPAVLVYGGANTGDLAPVAILGTAGKGDADGLAQTHPGHVGLVDVDEYPHRGQVGDDEKADG